MTLSRNGYLQVIAFTALALGLSLGAAGCRNAVDYAQEIIKARQNLDLSKEKIYTDALVRLGEDAIPGLMKLLEIEDPKDSVVVLFSDVIARFTYPDISWDEFYAACREENEFPEPKQLPWLKPVFLKAYENDSPLVRKAAVCGLPIHVPECAPAFLVKATSDPARGVRAMAFWKMPLVPVSDNVTQAIIRGMMDANSMVRSSAILTAAECRIKATLPTLVVLLEDASIIKWHAFVPGEIMWAKVPRSGFEPQIRELAAYAIQKITGKDFGFTTCYESRGHMADIIRRILEARLGTPGT